MSCSDCQHLCRRKLAGSCMTTNNGGRTVNTKIQLPPGISRPIFTKPTLRQRIERAFLRFWYAHVMDRQVHD